MCRSVGQRKGRSQAQASQMPLGLDSLELSADPASPDTERESGSQKFMPMSLPNPAPFWIFPLGLLPPNTNAVAAPNPQCRNQEKFCVRTRLFLVRSAKQAGGRNDILFGGGNNELGTRTRLVVHLVLTGPCACAAEFSPSLDFMPKLKSRASFASWIPVLRAVNKKSSDR